MAPSAYQGVLMVLNYGIRSTKDGGMAASAPLTGPLPGLNAQTIQALFTGTRIPLTLVAKKAGVAPGVVLSVIQRQASLPAVRQAISSSLGHLGIGHDQIWGEAGHAIPAPAQAPSPGCPTSLVSRSNRRSTTEQRIVLVVDSETTGGSPDRNALIELGLLALVFEKRTASRMQLLGVKDAYEGFQDPGNAEINPMAMRINKIPLAGLKGQKLDQARILQVIQGADCVIAHQAHFDRAFIGKVVPALDSLPWLCSYRGIPWADLGFPQAGLSKLCESLGIPLPPHRALADCRALMEVLNRPLGVQRSKGFDLLLGPWRMNAQRGC